MPRTLVELDHVLPGARKVPFPVVTGSARGRKLVAEPKHGAAARVEYLKLLAVYARTLIRGDPERSAAADLMGGGRPVKMVAEPLLRR